ncbi:MAG TPA: PQQ-binding-like beta-propeller repeat protein [Chloroflexia bacterium]|nr:PQQ-binding-like beta-propeller repeat protein [Chloroflexia bacterium]
MNHHLGLAGQASLLALLAFAAGSWPAGAARAGQLPAAGSSYRPSSPILWTATPNVPGPVSAALSAPGLYFDATHGNQAQIFIGGNAGIKQAYRGDGKALWNVALHGAVQDRAPIVDVAGTNVVFVTSQDGWVSALRAADGTSFWPLAQGQIAGSVVAGVAYEPAVNVGGTLHDLVFAGTYTDSLALDNQLVALDARTGAPVWSFGGGLGLVPTAPVVDWSNQTIYFGSAAVTGGGGQGVWAVNTTDGSLRWANKGLGSVVSSIPNLSADGHTLYVGTVAPPGGSPTYTLNALRTVDGGVRAAFKAPSGVGAWRGLAWVDGSAVYASAGDRLYAFSDAGASGTLPLNTTWTKPYQGGPGYAGIPGGGTPLSLAAAGRGTLYVGGRDGAVYKLQAADGTLGGRLDLGSGTAVSDLTYDVLHNAFYLTTGGVLYAIDGSW